MDAIEHESASAGRSSRFDVVARFAARVGAAAAVVSDRVDGLRSSVAASARERDFTQTVRHIFDPERYLAPRVDRMWPGVQSRSKSTASDGQLKLGINAAFGPNSGWQVHMQSRTVYLENLEPASPVRVLLDRADGVVVAQGGSDAEIRAMLSVAVIAGWRRVAFQGSDDFKERAMVVARDLHLGVEVLGADQRLLGRAEAEVERRAGADTLLDAYDRSLEIELANLKERLSVVNAQTRSIEERQLANLKERLSVSNAKTRSIEERQLTQLSEKYQTPAASGNEDSRESGETDMPNMVDSQTLELVRASDVSVSPERGRATPALATSGKPAIDLTPEQHAIVDCSKTGKSLSVRAKAGTGKTSTLKAVANANPDKKMLYLAFNNSIAREARDTFPSNVDVKTGHALAYPFIGRALEKQGRLVKSDFAIRSAVVEQFAPQLEAIGGKRREALNVSAFVVYDTVKAFMNSRADAIAIDHVPEDSRKLRPGQIVRTAQAVFDAMTNVEPGSTFPASHDAYLKAYMLTHPKLTQYAVILGDEWQDTNRSMQNLLDEQTHAQLVYVGDSSQAIYGFRGAIDALSELDHLPKFDLTQSFRFGPQVANVANAILAVKDDPIPVKGLPSISDHLLPARMPDVVLARTNAGLFHEAFATIPQLAEGERIAFVGGVAQVISMVTAAFDLWETGETAHRDFKYFKTWEELAQVVEDGQAAEYAPFVKLVDTYGDEIPRMCVELKTASVESEKQARVVFSTAHTFKGREAEVVRIAGDFPEICRFDAERKKFTLHTEEANLAYVGMTRAQLVLDASAYKPVLLQSLENRELMLSGELSSGIADDTWSSARIEAHRVSIQQVVAMRDIVEAAFEADVLMLGDVAYERGLAASEGLPVPSGEIFDERTKVGALVADALSGPYRSLVADYDALAREPRFLLNTTPHPVVDDAGIVFPSVDHAFRAAGTLDLELRKQIAAMPDAFGVNVTSRHDWTSVETTIMTDFIRQKFEDPDLARKLLVLDNQQLADFVAGPAFNSDRIMDTVVANPFYAESDHRLTNGVDMVDIAAIFAEVRDAIQERIVERLNGAGQPIDVVGLAGRIEGTDWEAGATATGGTLAAITAAGQVDPIKTGSLIDRFAQEAGATSDPDVAAIIELLRGALARGIDQGIDAAFTSDAATQSRLPIFEPKPTDLVSDRSAKKMVVNAAITVEGESADGATIFGRAKGNVVIGVTRAAFREHPQAGMTVMLKRVDGRDTAEQIVSDLALEIGR